MMMAKTGGITSSVTVGRPRPKKPKSSSRLGTLSAVNSPLAFYVLSLLIVETTLALVLVKSDLPPQDKFYGMWLAVAMFVVVVGLVTLLVWKKPENLIFDRDAHLWRQIPYGTDSRPKQAKEVKDLSSSPD